MDNPSADVSVAAPRIGERCDHPETNQPRAGCGRSPWLRKPFVKIRPIPIWCCASTSESVLADELAKRRLRPQLPRRAASVPERAKQIGVGESTLEGEIREGRLEAIKVKARTLITDEAFDRWLATRERIKPKRAPVRPWN